MLVWQASFHHWQDTDTSEKSEIEKFDKSHASNNVLLFKI